MEKLQKTKFEEIGEVDIDTLTNATSGDLILMTPTNTILGNYAHSKIELEQYMVLNQGINGPSVVKPKIAYNVHSDIKGQFMKELRDNTFAGNRDDDAHENVQKVLEIVDLFSILGVTHVAIMLRVFPITLTKASRRWKEKLPANSDSSDDIAAITNKLDNLGRYMKKLKENIHAIQVGYEICEGMHLDKECPLREEGKAVEQEIEEMVKVNKESVHQEALVSQMLESLRELKINCSFIRGIKRNPEYAMYMKDLVSNKPKIKDGEAEFDEEREYRWDMTLNPGKPHETKTVASEPSHEECDRGNANDETRRNDAMSLWTCMYDDERTETSPTIMKKKTLLFKEHLRRIHKRVFISKFGDEKMQRIHELIEDQLDDDWYMGPTHDEDDLNSFGEYLELHASDGFTDVGEKEYKEKMCKLIRMTYKKPPSITIEKFKITRYTIGPKERYEKVKVKETDEIPRTMSNVDVVRAKLMEERTHMDVSKELLLQVAPAGKYEKESKQVSSSLKNLILENLFLE
nr:hypothetical protein [Tanacetum cinerariifolium]